MIKILNVIGSLDIGGAENNAMNILRFIDSSKFSYYFLVFGDFEGNYEEEARSLGATIIHMEEPKVNYKDFISNYRKLLKKEKFDVIHVNTLWNSGILLSAAKREGIPIRICHSHSTESSQNENFIYKLYKQLMRRLILNSTTNFIACGKDAGNYLYGEDVFQKKGRIIYNGIEDEKFSFNSSKREEVRKSLGFSSNETVLGHVGRIAPVKNHPFMINILDSLNNRMSTLKLILIGDGPDLVFVKNMVESKELEESVIFLGNRKNVSEYLQALDIFVFPSLFEGFPVSLIEAQAAGLPCLVSSRVTKEARLTMNTEFIDLENFDEWLNRIQYYANNKIDRSQINTNEIKKKFSVHSIVKKWEKIYEEKK